MSVQSPLPNPSRRRLFQAMTVFLVVWLVVSTACVAPAVPFLSSSPTPTQIPPTRTPVPPTPSPTPVPQTPPVLVETQPESSGDLSAQGPITLTFNQPMEHASVEGAVQGQPALSGHFEWTNDTTVKFIPDKPFSPGSDQSLTVSTNARAANGLQMVEAVTLAFKVPGYLKLLDRLPKPDTVDTDPGSAVVASFSAPVVELSAEITNQAAAFTLDPPASGRGVWLNTSTYIFYPDPPLQGGTAYKVTPNSALVDTNGSPLAADQVQPWSFSTANPKLLSYTPKAGSPIPLDATFTLEFNQPMDTTNVEQSFSLQDSSATPVPGHFTWNDAGTQLTFKPDYLLARTSVYTMMLVGLARGRSGTSLGENILQNYNTYPEISLVDVTPTELGGNFQSGYASIFLNFSAPVDPNQAFDGVVIFKPPLDNPTYYVSDGSTSLTITAPFRAGTLYTVTATAGLRDIWGSVTPTHTIITFRTPPALPALTIPMMQFGTNILFVPLGEKAVTAQAVNLRLLNITSNNLTVDDFIHYAMMSSTDVYKNFSAPPDRKWLQGLTLAPNVTTTISLSLTPSGVPLQPGLYYYSYQTPELSKNAPPGLSFMGVVSHIHLLLKYTPSQLTAWAVDLNDNSPVNGLSIAFRDRNGNVLGAAVTDAQGLAELDITPIADDAFPVIAVAGQAGDPDFSLAMSNWQQDVAPWTFGLPTSDGRDQPLLYLYTDRPIYQPGQAVHFRAVVRQNSNGRYTALDTKQITVRLQGDYTAMTGQFPQLGAQTLQLDPFGSTFGSFQIPADAPPGYYNLSVDEAKGEMVSFQVAQYRKPEFDVQVSFPQPAVKSGSGVQATIKAAYYFGAPAGGLDVQWALYAQHLPFSLPNDYQVGKVDLGWANGSSGFTPGHSDLGNFLIQGDAKTAPDGTLQVSLPWSTFAIKTDFQQSQTLTLEATAVDESGNPVSGRGQLLVHPADYYIGVRPAAWMAPAGSEIGFDIQTTDWDGGISGEHALTARFVKVTWKKAGYLDATGVAPLLMQTTQTGTVDYQTDTGGRARLVFVPPDPGIYMLETSGDTAITQVLVWVGGAGSASWPDLPNQHIRLSTDALQYKPGQTAHIFIPNPFGDHTLALITVERSKVMRSQVIYLTKAGEDLALPLSEEDAPNVYVSVTLMGRSQNGALDFRIGYQELQVDASQKHLQVSLTTKSEVTGPGGEVKFTVQVKDDQGKPVQGEFSLALVDKAVLALANPNSPDIFKAFYGRQPLGVANSLDLAIYAQRVLPLSAGGLGGGGGGAQPSLRQNFQDTAYWNGSIITDANGMAEVSLTLPDNLTTWVADLRGLTTDTRVGSATQELVSTKDLLIRPETPAFFVEGDHVQLAAIIHNNTAQDLTVDVAIQATGITLDDPGQSAQQAGVIAGGRQKVTWWGTVQNVADVDLVFNASSGDLNDASTPPQGKLPVLHYSAPQTFATAGVLAEGGARQELIGLPHSFTPTGGLLSVELSPSLAATILSGLDALETFQFESSEALLSRLLPNLMTYQALQKLSLDSPSLKNRLSEAIKDSSVRLLAAQNQDGGWGWSPGSDSEAYITAYVLYGLAQLNLAGIAIDPGAIGNAQTYLSTKVSAPLDPLTTQPWQLDELAFMQYALQQSGRSDADPTGLYDFRDKLDPWSKAFLAMTLNAKTPGSELSRTLVSNLEGQAVRSATGVHWEDANPGGNGLSTPNFATAVVMEALAQLDPASTLLPDAVRYLAVNRRPNGAWSSSYETAWVLMALTDVMQGTGDLQASYAFSASLNGTELLKGKAGGPDALTPVSGTVTLDKLKADRSNSLNITRDAGSGRLYYRINLQVDRPADTAQPVSQGLSIDRRFVLSGQDCRKVNCPPINGLKIGDLAQPVFVHLTLTVPTDMQYLVVDDFIPAGAMVADSSLRTTQRGQTASYSPDDPFGGAGWGWWYFGTPRIYSDHISWAARSVPAGTYELTYQILPAQAGEFRVIPAHVYEYYFPEVEGSSAGSVFSIAP
jgi:alpha-2-macroglobulin